ncbi:HalOD1 output domain-containing protein [Haloarcula nitratireducens]|uniref:Halobacterial output domain-containing protein n=1 Tax=Haloarcula nitratireducens TaxID=2487749 RepID=A0AAW4PKX5_9EURY|nr:hypothetical protein [Halomicroarcula nitratireducens]
MRVEIEAGEEVSQVIVRTVSQFEDRPVVELPLLSEAVDPDALNKLSSARFDSTSADEYTVSFDYSKSHIFVNGSTSIVVSSNQPQQS